MSLNATSRIASEILRDYRIKIWKIEIVFLFIGFWLLLGYLEVSS
jgi:hypothetical protein